jgi:hypothetical protein
MNWTGGHPVLNEVLTLTVFVALLQSGTVAPRSSLPIVGGAQRRPATPPLTPLDRPFGSFFITCEDLPANRQLSIEDALGPDVQTLSVRLIVGDRWRTFDQVRDHIRRVLRAPIENGRPLNRPWSEATMLQLAILVEWNDGRHGRLDLGHGPAGEYAHFEDRLGCEWFARLGPLASD